MASIIISSKDFNNLSTDCQQEILRLFQDLHTKIGNENSEKQINTEESEQDYAGELTKKQVNDLMTGLSDKIKDILKKIVEYPHDSVLYQELLRDLGMQGQNMGGIWAGLTKRSRTVSKDPEFALINWDFNESQGDFVIKLHPQTYRYIQNYFNK
jgi:hypothetical protein